MEKTPTAGSSAIAALIAAFASLFLLTVVVVFGMAISDSLTGSEALAASGFVAVLLFVVGSMFTPIAALLGAVLGAVRQPGAAWLVGPVVGAVISYQISKPDDLWLIGIGVLFGFVNAAFYTRIERTLRPQRFNDVLTGEPFFAAER